MKVSRRWQDFHFWANNPLKHNEPLPEKWINSRLSWRHPFFTNLFAVWSLDIWGSANSTLVSLHYNHNQRYSSAQNWASERETCSSPPCDVYLRGESFMCAYWAKCLLKPWHDPNRHEHTGGLKPRAVGQTLNTMTSSPIPASPSALQTMPGQENKPSISVHSCAFVSLSIRQRHTTQA